MKTINQILLGAALSISALVCSTNANAATESDILPTGLEKAVIELAESCNFISSADAQILLQEQALSQCVDAFVASGFKPSAATDKIAEIGVRCGRFQSVEQVKAELKSTAEAARRDDSLWKKVYNVLGL